MAVRESTAKHALIVDDDDPIRTMLCKVIGRNNIVVDTARDGEEAIQRIDAGDYDVILLDLMMPRIDGFGVLRHLQETKPEMLRCTIVASAIPESEVLRRFGTPVYKIHPKPFDLQRLVHDITDCVGQQRQAS